MGLLSGIMGNAGAADMQQLHSDYEKLLAPGEKIEAGYRVLRDTFVFTTLRLILVDIQGMTGKKVEYLSIPYSKITMFSIETAGHFDLDAELKIWIGSNPVPIAKRFDKNANIYEVQALLAGHVSK